MFRLKCSFNPTIPTYRPANTKKVSFTRRYMVLEFQCRLKAENNRKVM